MTAGSLLIAVFTATLALCMAYPLRWDGIGYLGAIARIFPLHLLVITGIAGVLALIARRRGSRRAVWVFCGVAALSAVMALKPTLGVMKRARQLEIRLSLGDYLANAFHVNEGLPQRDRSVVYAIAPDGTSLNLDVWSTGQPNTGPLRPAVIVVHGGGWTHGNRSMLPDWNRWLNTLGYEVFDVEYRMPPPARWKEEVGDVKAALGWVDAHAADYHVDRTRLTLMGSSAGANLAMLAAYSAGDPLLPPTTGGRAVSVESVINFYGPTDMILAYHAIHSKAYIQAQLVSYIGGTPDDFLDRYKLLSPLTHLSAKSPRTLTLLGSRDRLVSRRHALLLDEGLSMWGVSHQTIFLPGNDHGFDANWGGFGTQIARARIKDFLLDTTPSIIFGF